VSGGLADALEAKKDEERVSRKVWGNWHRRRPPARSSVSTQAADEAEYRNTMS